MGSNSEVTPGSQIMTSSFLLKKINFIKFLCYLIVLNEWVKNLTKTIPKKSFVREDITNQKVNRLLTNNLPILNLEKNLHSSRTSFNFKQHNLWTKGFRLSIKLRAYVRAVWGGGKQNSWFMLEKPVLNISICLTSWFCPIS